MPSLLDLPSELIPSIFGFLEKADVFAARLSNKRVESSSLSYFGKTFFRKKGYLITHNSIKVLKSIASHDELRKYVQHVWFNPDCYTFVTPQCAPEQDLECDDAEDDDDEARISLKDRVDLLSETNRRRYEFYKACILDHVNLLFGFRLEHELATAFANLPNLHVVGMRRSEDHSPWGWQRLKDLIGEDPRILGPIPIEMEYDLSGSTLLLIALVNSLAASRASVQRFYTDAIEIDNIRPEFLSQEKLNVAFRSLQYLEINANKARLHRRIHPSYATMPNRSACGQGLLKIFDAAPSLLEVGLQIFPDLKQRRWVAPTPQDAEFWENSYPYISFQKLQNHDSLSRLTRLKLEKITTHQDVLRGFLEPAESSLQSLKIRDLRLVGGKDDAHPWRVIFQCLCDKFLILSYILLYHLMYGSGGISFVELSPTSAQQDETFTLDVLANLADGGFFAKYDQIALEVSGRAEVAAKLEEVVDRHWYQKPMFSYAMDDSLWHTDTSDEEW